MSLTREQIDQDQITIDLKNRLYAIRNKVLDYLVENDLDEKVYGLLDEAQSKLSHWSETFQDYLITDDDYYSKVAHRILSPVHLICAHMEGSYLELEEERDRLFKMLQELEAEK